MIDQRCDTCGRDAQPAFGEPCMCDWTEERKARYRAFVRSDAAWREECRRAAQDEEFLLHLEALHARDVYEDGDW